MLVTAGDEGAVCLVEITLRVMLLIRLNAINVVSLSNSAALGDNLVANNHHHHHHHRRRRRRRRRPCITRQPDLSLISALLGQDSS